MEERRSNCIAHRKDTERLTEQVDELRESVYGNGQPGLKTRMTVVETNFAAVGKSISIGATVLGVLQVIVGATVAVIVWMVGK